LRDNVIVSARHSLLRLMINKKIDGASIRDSTFSVFYLVYNALQIERKHATYDLDKFDLSAPREIETALRQILDERTQDAIPLILRVLNEVMGFKNKHVAEACGCTKDHISRIKSDRNEQASPELAQRIRAFYSECVASWIDRNDVREA